MTETNHVENVTGPTSVTAKLNMSAAWPAAAASTFPPAPITDNGQIRLGAQSPMFGSHKGQVTIGAQAPMFLPNLIADQGLVRLGAQSPAL
jgi:hypothetical protein